MSDIQEKFMEASKQHSSHKPQHFHKPGEDCWSACDPETGEVRTVDPDTGGEKGAKIERYDLIPVEPLRQVAKHYGVGAKKYAERNWELGYDWSKSFAAMQRHAWQFWGGEDIDPETGSHHMAAVIFHAMALIEWAETHQEKDDRPK